MINIFVSKRFKSEFLVGGSTIEDTKFLDPLFLLHIRIALHVYMTSVK